MADLHKIVDLHPAPDVSFADAGAVDAGIRLDFHIVFDHDGRRLRNLVPLSFGSLGEAESVGADDDAVLQEDVVADPAILADYRVRMRKEIVADLYAR